LSTGDERAGREAGQRHHNISAGDFQMGGKGDDRHRGDHTHRGQQDALIFVRADK